MRALCGYGGGGGVTRASCRSGGPAVAAPRCGAVPRRGAVPCPMAELRHGAAPCPCRGVVPGRGAGRDGAAAVRRGGHRAAEVRSGAALRRGGRTVRCGGVVGARAVNGAVGVRVAATTCSVPYVRGAGRRRCGWTPCSGWLEPPYSGRPAPVAGRAPGPQGAWLPACSAALPRGPLSAGSNATSLVPPRACARAGGGAGACRRAAAPRAGQHSPPLPLPLRRATRTAQTGAPGLTETRGPDQAAAHKELHP